MKIGDSKVIDFNDINKRNILIVIILMIFFIGTTTMIYHYGYDKGYKEGTTKTTTTTDSYTSPSLTTEITAASKTNTSDPDFHYFHHCACRSNARPHTHLQRLRKEAQVGSRDWDRKGV